MRPSPFLNRTALALALALAPAASFAAGCGGMTMGGHAEGGPHHGGMHEGGMPMGKHGKDARAEAPAATVTATGRGEASAAPDLATVTVGVSTQGATATEAMAANASRQQAVLDTLAAQGIAPRDVQTSGFNLSPQMEYVENQAPRLIGYQVSNMVTVRVRALEGLGGVLDALVAAGANEIQGVGFTRENAAGAEAGARRRAVARATATAEVLAEASGHRLGRLVSLTEAGGGGWGPQPMMMAGAAARDAKSTPIATGEMTISAEVQGTWTLLPMPEGCPMHGDDHAGKGGKKDKDGKDGHGEHDAEGQRGKDGAKGHAKPGHDRAPAALPGAATPSLVIPGPDSAPGTIPPPPAGITPVPMLPAPYFN